MSEQVLFSSFQLGRITLRNRVVMAPMTRNRSIGNVPGDIVVRYYEQRAEAGLIITEGTSPAPDGLGYARIPGVFSAEQVAAWKKVSAAVHAKGGHIFVQLMHTGRASAQANLPAGARVLGPSAIALSQPVFVDADGQVPATMPETMTEADIEAAIEQFAHASAMAIEAGFDGVELHGANGYLIEQFLNTASNARDDRWGGIRRCCGRARRRPRRGRSGRSSPVALWRFQRHDSGRRHGRPLCVFGKRACSHRRGLRARG